MPEKAQRNFDLGGKAQYRPKGCGAVHWPRGGTLGCTCKSKNDKLQNVGLARLMQQGNDRKEQLWCTG